MARVVDTSVSIVSWEDYPKARVILLASARTVEFQLGWELQSKRDTCW